MKITEFLNDRALTLDLKAKDKKGVITELVDLLIGAGALRSKDRSEIVKILMERESLGSTGIGQGVAIPHGKTELMKSLVAAFGLSRVAVMEKVAYALSRSGKPPVIWLEGQDCAGCSVSFTGSLNPPAAEIILDKISLRYHETVMVASGHQSEEAFAEAPLSEEFFRHFSGEHEQVLEIIESIRTDAGRVYSANLPNLWQVENLPEGAVLESPARALSTGLRLMGIGPLPAGIAGIITKRLAWVETVVEAALEGSREKFVQALVLDGSVESLEQARKMGDELLEAQKEHLPWWK